MLDMSLTDRRIGLPKRLLRETQQKTVNLITYAQLGCGLAFEKEIARVRESLSSLTEASVRKADNLGEAATEV